MFSQPYDDLHWENLIASNRRRIERRRRESIARVILIIAAVIALASVLPSPQRSSRTADPSPGENRYPARSLNKRAVLTASRVGRMLLSCARKRGQP